MPRITHYDRMMNDIELIFGQRHAWLSIKQIQRLTGEDYQQVYKWVTTGQLRSRQHGRGARYSVHYRWLADFIESQEKSVA